MANESKGLLVRPTVAPAIERALKRAVLLLRCDREPAATLSGMLPQPVSPWRIELGSDIRDLRVSCWLREGGFCRRKLPGNGDSDPIFATGKSRFA